VDLKRKKASRPGGPERLMCATAKEEQRYSPNSHKKPHGLSRRAAQAFTAGKACVICGDLENLVVDHCHESKRVRDVLCGRCNLGLGLFRDNPLALRVAAEYVEAHKKRASALG
jgi:hypothetical protein